MGHIMPRPVKRLHDLEIDEISLVDRPANQFGLMTIAKRSEENAMPKLFDANGDEVLESELQIGDVVYDEDDNELEFVAVDEDGTSAGLDPEYEDDYEDEYEPVLVGKAFAVGAGGVAERLGSAATRRGNLTNGKMKRGAAHEFASGFGGYSRPGVGSNANRAGGHLGRNKVAYGAGGAAVATGETARRVRKSLGQSVLEDLSKALDDGDRDQVIAKAMDQVSKAEQRTAELEQIVKNLAYQNEIAEYTEIAKSYGLPGDPARLAEVLKNAVDVLPAQDVRELDRLLTAQGAMYAELGSAGTYDSSEIMGQFSEMALQTVGKADGITTEQATVALFEANPDAYDAYLAENRS